MEHEEKVLERAARASDRFLGRLLRFHPERAVTPNRPIEVINVTENVIVPLPTEAAIHSGMMTKMNTIASVVGEFYNITPAQLTSHTRVERWLLPRQIAMYLCRRMTVRSYPEIGLRFGGRDHTTVMSAVKKITAMVQYDERLADEVEILKLKIRDRELNQRAA